MKNKKRNVELTKKFMEEHGERKKIMKGSWSEYISKLDMADR